MKFIGGAEDRRAMKERRDNKEKDREALKKRKELTRLADPIKTGSKPTGCDIIDAYHNRLFNNNTDYTDSIHYNDDVM